VQLSMPWQRWRTWVPPALVGVVVAMAAYPLFVEDPVNSDWLTFAAGGRIVMTNPTSLYDLSAQFQAQEAVAGGRFMVTIPHEGLYVLPFVYPTPVAVLAAAFVALGADLGGRLWMLAQLLLTALGFWLACRNRPLVGLAGLASIPVAQVVLRGQVDGLVVLGVGAAVALVDYPFWAGAVLVLALAKPHLVLPLLAALLFARKWRMLAGLVLGASVGWAAGALVNLGWFGEWLQSTAYSEQLGTSDITIASLGNYLDGNASLWVVALVSLLAVAAVLWLAASTPDDMRTRIAVLVAAGPLAAPHAFAADMVLVALGLVIWGRAHWTLYVVLSAVAWIAGIATPPWPRVAALVIILACLIISRSGATVRHATGPPALGSNY
jgi:hypothetical protein